VGQNVSIPLSVKFSASIAHIAPYLNLKQINFLLQARSDADWQENDLRRLKYISSVKKKVMEISESYGGLSFLPQSFLVSIFVGEATATSMRAPSSSNGATSGERAGGPSFGVFVPSPAGRIASFTNLATMGGGGGGSGDDFGWGDGGGGCVRASA
jgi:hypothetical protein